jgi:hypothetical protein
MSTDNDTIYIGGQWVTPSSTSKIEIQSIGRRRAGLASYLLRRSHREASDR